MNFNDGIVFIFISLLTFLVDSSIKSLTDNVENHDIFKKRMVKYSISSLLIVIIYFLFYFFNTKTTKFMLTTDDSIILLLIYVFSIIYFNLNASISTLLNRILTRRNKKEHLFIFMMVSNIIIPLIIFLLVGSLLKGQNFLNEEAKGIIKVNKQEYSVIIPQNTSLIYDFIPSQSGNNHEINQLFDPINSSSEYEIKSGSNITLFKGTYLKYFNQNNYLTTKDGDKVSEIEFQLTENSLVQLKETIKVELSENTLVSIQQRNNFLSVQATHLFLLGLLLIIYYPIKNQYGL